MCSFITNNNVRLVPIKKKLRKKKRIRPERETTSKNIEEKSKALKVPHKWKTSLHIRYIYHLDIMYQPLSASPMKQGQTCFKGSKSVTSVVHWNSHTIYGKFSMY